MALQWFDNSGELLGIDLGQHALKLVHVRRPLSRPGARWTAVQAPQWMRHEPEYPNTARQLALSESIREAMRANGLAARSAALLLPRVCLSERQLQLGPMPAGERQQAVAWQMATQLDAAPEQLACDYLPLGPEQDDQPLDVLGLAVRESTAQAYIEAVRGAGLNVQAIDAPAAAMLRALEAVQPDGRSDQATAVIDIGHAGALLLIVRGGRLRFARRIALNHDDAQAATPLAREMAMSLQHYAQTAHVARPRSGLVFGGRADDAAFREQLAEQAGLTLEQPHLGSLGLSDDAPHSLLVPALGLSLYHHDRATEAGPCAA